MKVSDITKDSATLSWDAPKSDGGSPVSHYIIEERQNSEGEFVQVLISDGSTYSVTIDGLAPDSNYEFRVFAQNEAGSSESPAEMKSPVTTAKAIGESCYFVFMTSANAIGCSSSGFPCVGVRLVYWSLRCPMIGKSCYFFFIMLHAFCSTTG